MPDLVSLYERWGAAFAAEPEMSLDRWRAMVEEWPQLTAEPGGVDYVEVDAGGVPAIWIAPKGAAEDRGDPLDSRRRFRRWVDVHAPQAVRSPGKDGRCRSPRARLPPPPRSTCTQPRSTTWFARTIGCSAKGSTRRTSRSPATRRAEGWS